MQNCHLLHQTLFSQRFIYTIWVAGMIRQFLLLHSISGLCWSTCQLLYDHTELLSIDNVMKMCNLHIEVSLSIEFKQIYRVKYKLDYLIFNTSINVVSYVAHKIIACFRCNFLESPFYDWKSSMSDQTMKLLNHFTKLKHISVIFHLCQQIV